MTRNELIKKIVPAIKMHWENTYKGKTYSERHIYNCIKGNKKEMLENRYQTLKKMGYITD